jgi:preprotein translocase subunit SecD
MENGRTRTLLLFLFIFFCAAYLLPNFVNLPKGWWLPNKPLHYGLDIQGGAHLVYGVDVKGVLQERTERMARSLAQEMKAENVELASAGTNEDKNTIVLTAKNPEDRAKVAAHLKDRYAATLQVTKDEGNTIEAKYYETALEEYRRTVINQAIQVIRNRIDEFGVAEPVIAAQGTDRILVQLPGVSDPARAKELINKTARLDFHMVDTSMTPPQVAQLVADAEKEGHFALGKDGMTYAQYFKKVNELVKPKLPPNTFIAFEKRREAATMEAGKTAYLLRSDTDISGDLLEDAYPSQNGQTGEPDVVFRFGMEGAKKFGALTSANIHKQLAIVLDQVVFSAPVIQSRIDKEGSISINTGDLDEATKEASLLATALRAGALPAALQQFEERSVGPSLGADSVSKGKMAGVIGLIGVIVFACAWYRIAGMVASICLGLNVAALLAMLSALGATLTLPGIAGISLTVGMAIDANVIIYERIKEEIARGTSLKNAIGDGFKHAWTAIFDSNVTTAIAASVLIYFGTGPVRGFGVTLIAGIVSTVITAVFVSHYLLDLLVTKFNFKKNTF